LFGFFPWLAGRFHNFELTQNREKTRNGLMYVAHGNKESESEFNERVLFELNNAV
jgi:hypothetical protein